jgi:hypothetical protein
VVNIAQIKHSSESNVDVAGSGGFMDTNERQIALSVLESLRGDLIYAHLNNGSRVLDVADFRQYIYEQMGKIRTNAFTMSGLYGNENDSHAVNNNGHNGKANQ